MEHCYFFKPRTTSQWKENGLLVVGINHWCVHFDDCENYNDCIKHFNCHKYDETCPYGYSEVTGEKYLLRYSTYEAFHCYYEILRQLEDDEDLVNKVGLGGYGCFKEFMLYMEGKYDDASRKEQQDFWDRVAFYNYIQHFTSKPLTSTSEGVKNELAERLAEDLEAFCNVLKELRPQFVVVFHRNIAEILEEKKKLIQEKKIFLKKISRLAVPTRSYILFYCNTSFCNREKTMPQILEKLPHSSFPALRTLYSQIKDWKEELSPNKSFSDLCDYISLNSKSESVDCFKKFVEYCCSKQFFEKDKEGYYKVKKQRLMSYTQFYQVIKFLCQRFDIEISEPKKAGSADDFWDYIINFFRNDKGQKFSRQNIMQSLAQSNSERKAKEIIKNFDHFLLSQ